MRSAIVLPFLLSPLILLAACAGEDRSGEQPFPPTVVTLQAQAEPGRCTLHGEVKTSPNSSLLKCGFLFGNDTLKQTLTAQSPDFYFSATVDSLQSGAYYAVAFAENGMGEGRGDTVYIWVP